jgi:hypothetical protein
MKNINIKIHFQAGKYGLDINVDKTKIVELSMAVYNTSFPNEFFTIFCNQFLLFFILCSAIVFLKHQKQQ